VVKVKLTVMSCFEGMDLDVSDENDTGPSFQYPSPQSKHEEKNITWIPAEGQSLKDWGVAQKTLSSILRTNPPQKKKEKRRKRKKFQNCQGHQTKGRLRNQHSLGELNSHDK
jgi:hypothetical protein